MDIDARWALLPYEQERLAAQIVAVMGATFRQPQPDEMRRILKLAEQQITARELYLNTTFQVTG